MSEPGTTPKGGPPRAGIITGVVAVIVVVLIAIASRSPGPPAGSPAASSATRMGGAAGSGEPGASDPGTTPVGNAPLAGATPPNAPVDGSHTPSPEAASNTAPASPTGSNGPAPVVPPQTELPPDHPPVTADESRQVSIQWLGHSCFYIHSPGGAAVVIDPFDPRATGLPAPATGAHLVAVSAEDPGHNHVEAVHPFQGETREVVRGKEARKNDLRLVPVPLSGSSRFAYVVETAGLRIAHLGNLRAPLTDAQVRALGPVDILMVPAGGGGISSKQAVEVARKVSPRVVIPMAYSTVQMEGPDAALRPVQEFVSASPYAVTAKDTDIVMISKAELPPSTEIYTLRYGR